MNSEQEEEIKRLLQEARVDEPMPPEVAERLNATLNELSAASPRADTDPIARPALGEEGAAAQVRDLNAAGGRRASRLAPVMLVAAASVLILMVGGAFFANVMRAGEPANTDLADNKAGSAAAQDGLELDAESAPEADPKSKDTEETLKDSSRAEVFSGSELPVVRRSTFAKDVSAALTTDLSASKGSAAEISACAEEVSASADSVLVTWKGRTARLLVTSTDEGGTGLIYSCSGKELYRQSLVP